MNSEPLQRHTIEPSKPSRVFFWINTLLIAVFTVDTLIVLDWCLYVDPYVWASLWARAIVGVTWLLVSTCVATVLARLHDRVRGAVDTVSRTRLRTAALGLVVICATVLAARTDPVERLTTVVVDGGEECVVKRARDRRLVELLVQQETPVTLDARQRVECTKLPTIDRRSMFTRLAPARTSDHPSAEVELVAVNGSVATVGLPDGRQLEQQLFCVKSAKPLSGRALAEALSLKPGALKRARLELGYPAQKVQIRVGGSELARLLIQAGFAEASDHATSECRLDEENARKGKRGRWYVAPPPTPPPAPVPPAPPKSVSLLVQRGSQLRHGRTAYVHRIEASAPSVLDALESVRIESSNANGQRLNGPLAYQRCGAGSNWELVSDDTGPERGTCDAESLHHGCECRLVLTSERCASKNTIYLQFTGHDNVYEQSFSGCKLLGENLSKDIDRFTQRLSLSSTAAGGWQWSVAADRTVAARCGTDCGPGPAEGPAPIQATPEVLSAPVLSAPPSQLIPSNVTAIF